MGMLATAPHWVPIPPHLWSSLKLPQSFLQGNSYRKYSMTMPLAIPNVKICQILGIGSAIKCCLATVPLGIWWSTSLPIPQLNCLYNWAKCTFWLMKWFHTEKNVVGGALSREGTNLGGGEWRKAVNCAIQYQFWDIPYQSHVAAAQNISPQMTASSYLSSLSTILYIILDKKSWYFLPRTLKRK